MTTRASGGCACGIIRYTVEIADFDAYLCHCRMCQRAAGNVSLALKSLPKASRVQESEPDWYVSSPIARRPFCGRCGTSLGFEYIDSEQCDITVASLDDASRFVPTHSFGTESRHDAWSDTSALPGTRCVEYAALNERWRKAGLDVPD